MDSIVKLLTGRDFLIALLAAVSVAAIVFTLGGQLIVRSDLKDRIKRVALEREKLRAEEMARKLLANMVIESFKVEVA